MRLPSKLAFLLDALKGPLGYAAGTCTVGDGAAVLRRLLGGHSLHDGPYVEAYRRELSRYLGVKHVYTYGAGRMAMYALLKAMNLDEDDEIIMPGYNCIVIPNAIRFAGLKPVYVDISEDDFNIDPDRIEAALTRRTKALVVQHTFGIAGDMDALSDLSRRKGLPLIEDCAHALGGMLDGRQLGTIAYAGFYSTEATKMFSTEKGGILVTTHDDLAARLDDQYGSTPFRPPIYERRTALRFVLRCLMGRPLLNVPIAFARVFDSTTRLNWLGGVLLYDQTDYADELRGHRTEPYPCRLGNLMSYAGLRQLGRFDQDLAHRRRVVRELERTLPGKGARLPRYDRRRARPSWVRYPFVVDDREAWIRRIRRLGIEPGTWLNDPIHPVRSNSDFAMYRRGSCPVAERIAKTILNVPVHSRMALWRIRRLRRLPPRDGAVAS